MSTVFFFVCDKIFDLAGFALDAPVAPVPRWLNFYKRRRNFCDTIRASTRSLSIATMLLSYLLPGFFFVEPDDRGVRALVLLPTA